MSPKPVTQFLTDFSGPRVVPHAAEPPGPGPSRASGERSAFVAANATDEAHTRAFAEGKEEGLKLAAARHALERRKKENEEDRLATRHATEAEQRVGAHLAERLEQQSAELRQFLEAELGDCLRPLLERTVERNVLDALATDAARVLDGTRWVVTGPHELVRGLLDRLPPDLTAQVDVRVAEEVDLTVVVHETTLRTRLTQFRKALDRLP